MYFFRERSAHVVETTLEKSSWKYKTCLISYTGRTITKKQLLMNALTVVPMGGGTSTVTKESGLTASGFEEKLFSRARRYGRFNF